MKSDNQKVSIYIPKDHIKKIKVLAAITDKKVSDIMRDMISQALQNIQINQ